MNKITASNQDDSMKIRANLNRIWTMAIEGKSVEEMKQTLDLKEVAGLKNALLGLIAEKGENLKIDGLDRASVNPTYTDQGIRIDPAMLEGSDYRTGDKFDIEVTPNNIILKRRDI